MLEACHENNILQISSRKTQIQFLRSFFGPCHFWNQYLHLDQYRLLESTD